MQWKGEKHHMSNTVKELEIFLSTQFNFAFVLVMLTHRIIEWFGLERTFKGHLAQTPCREQGHLQLEQAAQSPVQPDLESFQGWGIYALSGQPVPVCHHLHCKKFLLYTYLLQSESTLFQFEAITPCPIPPCPCEKSLSSFPVGPP